MCESLRTVAAERGIALSVEIDPQLSEVVVDRARLKQVLYNYLSNALKFTPAGGRVTARIRSHGSDEFQVEVEDTGDRGRHLDARRRQHLLGDPPLQPVDRASVTSPAPRFPLDTRGVPSGVDRGVSRSTDYQRWLPPER